MGATPNKAMRYPDLTQLGMGSDDFNKMAYDLDGAYTGEDTNRTAALFRGRACISSLIGGSAAKSVWFTSTYDTVPYDTMGSANLGVNNDRLTAKKQGAYLCTYGQSITIGGTLGASGAVLAGISKGISTVIPDPNLSVHQYSLLNNASVLFAGCWTVFQLNVNDFITSRIFWSGAPAGPFSVGFASLSMFLLNTT